MFFGLVYCIYNLLISFGIDLPSFWQPQSALQALLGIGLSLVVYTAVSLSTRPEHEKADHFIALARSFRKTPADH